MWRGLGDISVNLGPDKILSVAPIMKVASTFPPEMEMGLALFSFEG